ncbi:hypothetical protein [Thalassobacillus pellis]|uniref:hypothetical protein n=1 Tax=Thalassobacillus pellis TaxID=748008 RepID=UPI0019616356|nr:hypothetical protein [Thalassobacillus pellis]MBM7553426.1 hypothetical protein [Thalassobacillus pellis]
MQGSYCWDKTCVDTAGAPELLQDPIPVEGGSSIQVSFNDHQKPTDMNVTVIHNDTQTKCSTPLTTPHEPGIYYYEIMSYWQGEDEKNNGVSFYAFSIKVME